ncbi:Bug family tripartite tricarboxylate transporter substrate binding protein [Paracraurococcus lichenis]|uniref:Tripartite tricarboxylate transporter substrate binding protein n=1 Tax=Paracraurococcus lichenis TaxID=3064888 RepID=A0ABT9DVC2_9PROT|nr:tripartite tricarboxylate transporter substrate binding protein [Paracraurococcus sp. LOR1-02]MDO9707847.1 tripartite tricarboxylate transporter substrate binding protein [Paracraurococcus sp. LOR1-02]
MPPTALPRRALLAAGLATPAIARAQGGDWPRQTARFINLYAPGGANDLLCRAFCQAMTQITGQQFVVENRTGAGGTVGSDAIAKARADGYTMGLGGAANLAIAPSLFPGLPYDPARDYTHVTGLYRQPNVLIVNLDVPARTLPEFIALLRAHPGRFNYATGGAGTTPHLSGELFKRRTGTDMPFVQYRGGAPALVDLLAGQVQAIFDNLAGPYASIRDGKVRALAVTSPERSPVLPEVPTMAEVLPGFDLTSWNGMVAPAGLPPAMVLRMAALSHQALRSPEVVRVFTENGATPWLAGPEDYAAYARGQEPLMRDLVKASGATPG